MGAMARGFARVAVMGAAVLGVIGPASAGSVTLDEEVFEACRQVREVSGSPARGDVRSLARRFAGLADRTARRSLAPAFRDATSARERRRAVSAAARWCDRQAHAYEQVVIQLQVPLVLRLVDEAAATITGTVTPGASVQGRVGTAGRVVPGVVDSSGSFSLVVSDLPLGETLVTIEASAPLRYDAVPQSVRISRVESEAAYKASTREVPPDELKKDPAGLRGTRIYTRGEVFQYDSRTGLTAMLVNVRVVNPGRYEFWTDPVLVRLESAAQGSGIDEHDIIEVWGEVRGAYSYQTAIGGSNTVPEIAARYVNLVEKRAE